MTAFGWKAVIARMATISLSKLMDWSLIAPDFKYDGSLRDVYILGTSLDDWARVWGVLTADPDRLAFTVDGEPAMLPAKVEDVFRLRGSHTLCASYTLGKQRLNCHFFIEEEVEFDLDPKDVDGPLEAERLGQFLAVLGRATSKEVRLTPENTPEAIIARYDPTTGNVIWMPMTA